jgi:colanic acid biosynthesis glycosyl transferase WcaI
MRIQLWTYFYDPEPQGIAPLSTVLAKALQARGHDVLVVAAHPHYPKPVWGSVRRPYRERRDGVPILRLPLWIGRSTTLERIREELSFTLAQAAVAPFLPPADIVIAVTPCFPALAPALAFSRMRRIPLIMWLQDIVSDAAATTGMLQNDRLLAAARRFELATYRSAARIVVISETFRTNLLQKGVPASKIELVFNPSPGPVSRPLNAGNGSSRRILVMGNIGFSQGLGPLVEAFQEDEELASLGAELILAGHGVAAEDVRGRIESPRVQMLGVLDGPALEREIAGAAVGVISQRADISEFNFPSKLMHYLASGTPVLASVRPDSETARVVREAGAGWVTDAGDLTQFTATAAAVLRDRAGREAAAKRGFAYASEHFDPPAVAARFEAIMGNVAGERRPVVPG